MDLASGEFYLFRDASEARPIADHMNSISGPDVYFFPAGPLDMLTYAVGVNSPEYPGWMFYVIFSEPEWRSVY